MSEPSKSPTLSDRYWRLPWPARIGLVVIAALGALALIGQIRQAPPDQGRAAPSQEAAVATGQASLPAGQIGSGDWLVGPDVAPGTYRSAGPDEPGGYCMWSRRSDAGGELFDGSIIASNGTYDAGPMLVTIEASDVVFRTRGCAPFTPVG